MTYLRWYWLSSNKMTVTVGVDGSFIKEAPPIVRKFRGQSLESLCRWMKRQHGFQIIELEEPPE